MEDMIGMQSLALASAMPTASIAPASVAAATGQACAAELNVENAASMLRATDGWLGAVQNTLGRMTELAVRASDGTISNLGRNALQQEFAQMQSAIQSVTTGPDAMGRYNGLPLFQGRTMRLGADTNYASPDLTPNSAMRLASPDTGAATTTWGRLMTDLNVAGQANAQGALPELNLGLNRLGSLRSELGVVWGLVSPGGSPLNPSATAAASLADALQYTTFHQTMNALGSGTLLMQA